MFVKSWNQFLSFKSSCKKRFSSFYRAVHDWILTSASSHAAFRLCIVVVSRYHHSANQTGEIDIHNRNGTNKTLEEINFVYWNTATFSYTEAITIMNALLQMYLKHSYLILQDNFYLGNQVKVQTYRKNTKALTHQYKKTINTNITCNTKKQKQGLHVIFCVLNICRL